MKAVSFPSLLLPFLFALFWSAPSPLCGQEQTEVEARLRESLRGAMLQLRNVEAERARLDAELQVLTAQSERQVRELNARLEEALKRSVEEKTVADQRIEALQGSLAAEQARTAAFAESLDKWKEAYFKIEEIARAKEAERLRYLDKSLRLERTVADRERRNLTLYTTGKEILERYENFAFGRALAAREPFTGIARVRLEEQVQDYKDQLKDGRPGPGAPSPSPRAATAEETSPEDGIPEAPE